MSNYETILKAIGFIEENLKEDITVPDIACEIQYSVYHFTRLFHGITGHSPKDYILRRRLTEAAKEILNTDKKIIDIAFDYAFNDHETFTRAFKKMYGRNPSEIRKNIPLLKKLPFLSPITSENVYHLNRIRDTEYKIVSLNRIMLVGIVIRVNYDSLSAITEMWHEFLTETDTIPAIIKPERHYQLLFWSDKYDCDNFYCMAGVEVKNLDDVPIYLTAKIIPPAKYIKFIHRGFSNTVGLTYKYIYETWLPQSDYRLSIPYDFELYGEKYKGPDNINSESEIYIPVELST
jgi:AraC family transcriptional regulator